MKKRKLIISKVLSEQLEQNSTHSDSEGCGSDNSDNLRNVTQMDALDDSDALASDDRIINEEPSNEAAVMKPQKGYEELHCCDLGSTRTENDEENIKKIKKGVVYISRVPPYMPVTKLRHYMSQFGEVGRIFLTPEDNTRKMHRVRNGGSKKEMFKDGWIEFEKKKVAKFVGDFVNNKPVGGRKRRNFWRDDLWNLRYLPRFKWHHLMEHLSQRRRERMDRKRMELLQAKKENAHYLDQVTRKNNQRQATERRELKMHDAEQQE